MCSVTENWLKHCKVMIKERQPVFNLKADISLLDEDIPSILAVNPGEIAQKISDVSLICQRMFGAGSFSPLFINNAGTFHHIFKFQPDMGGTYFIKTSKLMSPYQSYNFHIDRQMEHTLAAAGLSTVQVLAVDCSKKVVPFDYMVMKEACGLSLAGLKDNPDVYRDALVRLGVFLAILHSQPAEKSGLIDCVHLIKTSKFRGEIDCWSDYIFTNLDAHLGYCVSRKIFDCALFSEIVGIFQDFRYLYSQTDCRLLHGDLNDANIFLNESVVTVIDWEDAMSGDPVFDIAQWGSFIGHHDNLDALVAGYQQISPLPDTFMLRYWLYCLRIAISRTVVRHRFGYYKTDLIPAITRILFPLENIRAIINWGPV